MKKKRTYSVHYHVTPDLKVYVGKTSDTRIKKWDNPLSYRTTGFADAINEWDWDSMNHHIVASGLDKEEAERMRKELVEAAGRVVLNERHPQLEKDFVESVTIPTKKQSNMKKAKKETKRREPAGGGSKVELMLDNRYMQQDGKYASVIRVYATGKYVYLKTGYAATPAEWDNLPVDISKSLNRKFDMVCDHIREKSDNGLFSIATIKGELEQRILGSVSGQMTLVGLIGEKSSMLDNSGSRGNYDRAAKHVEAVYKDGLPLAMVGKETMANIVKGMRAKELTDTTINIYLSVIKASINYGIYRGYIKQEQYPFKRSAAEIDKVAMPKSAKRDTNYLLKDDIKKIWDYFMTTKKPSKELGYFLFSYLHGGMNIADMMFLKFDDFYFNEQGFLFRRRKTAKKNNFNVILPATTWTGMLFQRLGITPEKGKYVFAGLQCDGSDKDYQRVKSIHSTYINKVLKSVCEKLGIRTVSMTTARHSFATVATKERMPYTLIEQAMGHAQNGVSSHYIGGWDINEMRSDFEKLLA